MPNIDFDEQEMQQVIIKQEADDSCYEVCYEPQCEPTSTSEKPARSQETGKRHSMEKSHPGIENVVEKLKKNAAALQEAALPPQKIEEPVDRATESIKPRRYSETIPKKLHILRSCASSLESVDAEVSSSQITLSERRAHQDQSSRLEDDGHASGKCDSSKECLLHDNNNDSKSSNNNIKTFKEKRLLLQNEKARCDATVTHIKPKTIWSCEKQLHMARKPDVHVVEDTPSSETRIRVTKQKPTVDLSGLELLSNSIEQLEQGIGQLKHPQADTENKQSPSKLMGQQGENNNNVDSPLGLLCALAEQRFMEEVGDKVPRKLNLESSEEISHAGRLLLNLGRGGHHEKDGKRKYRETDDHNSTKRFKLNDRENEEEEEEEEGEEETSDKNSLLSHYDEDVKNRIMEATSKLQDTHLKLNESTKRVIDFSMERIGTTAVKGNIELEGRSLDKSDENSQLNKRGAKFVKDPQPVKIPPSEASDESRRNDAYYDKVAEENNHSDTDGEVFESKIPSEQPRSCEVDDKRRISVDERDARDTHDYKNPRTKLEAKKFIARKGNRDNEDDWPNMNAMELDMRVRMADIQRQYREKQKELSKLIPKKDDKKNPGRPRKKSHSSR